MDIVDKHLETAARGASPERYANTPPGRLSNEIERIATASSASTESLEGSAVRREIGMSRMSTRRDLDLHPTAISRIQTQRNQHRNTVGRSLDSKESKKSLPAFGAGKPYPPMLPAEEDYVVEFDGPHDPLHAQNWPMKKRCVHNKDFHFINTNLSS